MIGAKPRIRARKSFEYALWYRDVMPLALWRNDSTQCSTDMNKTLRTVVWGMIALLGALALGVIALRRGEPINALWLVAAATCCYALGYRFYSAFIAAKILAVDPVRATPAERLENGRDFLATNKWVVFGHHSPRLPDRVRWWGRCWRPSLAICRERLWVIAGAVFGGCVQDFVILLFSVRRDGKSLTEMAKEETGPLGGFVAYVAVICNHDHPAGGHCACGSERAEG